MYNFGKDRDNLTVRTSIHLKAYLKARGKPINASMSQFAGMIFDWWVAQGAPSVHTAELGRPMLKLPPVVQQELDWEMIPRIPGDDPAAALKKEQERRGVAARPPAKDATARES